MGSSHRQHASVLRADSIEGRLLPLRVNQARTDRRLFKVSHALLLNPVVIEVEGVGEEARSVALVTECA